MALKRDRISIEVNGPSATPAMARDSAGQADEAVLTLARLLGRQIARERYERKIARERSAQGKRPAGLDG
jgi:hypothetical protein